MSTRRRQHQKAVAYQQLATSLRRTLQTLHDTERGPWSPGPWWPEGTPKHVPGEVWMEQERERLRDLERRREARNHGYHLACMEGVQGGMLRPCETCGGTPERLGDYLCRPCARKLRVCRRCGGEAGGEGRAASIRGVGPGHIAALREASRSFSGSIEP